MKDKDLNAFLASVRRTRFVDYLDPLGETAQNAFERRLSWARVSQHDPAYADEARFLLDNADDLRELLRRELEEDDWIEEADVGREWDTRAAAASAAPRANRMRENDRITEIFQPDDLEMTNKSGRGRQTPQPRNRRSTQEGASPRTTAPAGGSAVSERSSARGEAARGEAVRAAPRETRTGDTRNSEARQRDDRRMESPAQPVPGSANRSGSFGGTDRGAPDRAAPERSSPERTKPTAKTGARSPVAERAKGGSPATARPLGDGFREPIAPPKGRGTQQGDDEQTLRLGPNGAPAEVDFDDWDAPDDPVSSTGIMRIEDITSPPAERQVIGIDSSETIARPLLRNASQHSVQHPPQPVLVVDEVATAPTAATRLRRPGESGVGAIPRVRASVQEQRRSRVPLLVMGVLSLLGLGVLFVGGAALAPMIYTQTNGFKDLGFGRSAAAQTPQPTALVEPKAEPRAPSGSGPPPTPPFAVDPSNPVQPTPPSPQGVAPGTGPAPAQPTPAPVVPESPVPPKDKSKAGKEPTPEPQASNVPTPAPDSSARPLNIEGLWVGSTSSTRSFKLTVLGQTEGSFEGTVEVQLEDGTFQSLAITGKVDGQGAMSFKGDTASFSGKVSGRKATGSYTLAGKRAETWTAYGMM